MSMSPLGSNFSNMSPSTVSSLAVPVTQPTLTPTNTTLGLGSGTTTNQFTVPTLNGGTGSGNLGTSIPGTVNTTQPPMDQQQINAFFAQAIGSLAGAVQTLGTQVQQLMGLPPSQTQAATQPTAFGTTNATPLASVTTPTVPTQPETVPTNFNPSILSSGITTPPPATTNASSTPAQQSICLTPAVQSNPTV